MTCALPILHMTSIWFPFFSPHYTLLKKAENNNGKWKNPLLLTLLHSIALLIVFVSKAFFPLLIMGSETDNFKKKSLLKMQFWVGFWVVEWKLSWRKNCQRKKNNNIIHQRWCGLQRFQRMYVLIFIYYKFSKKYHRTYFCTHQRWII